MPSAYGFGCVLLVASLNPLTYSSTAAFVAHYRALTQAANASNSPNALSRDELERLNSMRSLMSGLSEKEKALLGGNAVEGGGNSVAAETRHRQRAEAKLRRMLTEKGILRD